jgi:hypothetical protein
MGPTARLGSCIMVLPSARDLALDKGFFIFLKHFDACPMDDTQQGFFFKKTFAEGFRKTLDKVMSLLSVNNTHLAKYI